MISLPWWKLAIGIPAAVFAGVIIARSSGDQRLDAVCNILLGLAIGWVFL